MRGTQIGTTIVFSTIFALGTMSAIRGNETNVIAAQRMQSEDERVKNARTIAQEIISNNKNGVNQYLRYPVDVDIGKPLPTLEGFRLTSYQSSKSGLYYSTAILDGKLRVRSIHSIAEVETAISLVKKEPK